ncbi:hypothetical protein M9Y10_043633 [Tritrichomonas musculus]|uniref:Uncharacterized protein n=1 Tax=Tritrichomonas musculus TaxID=1915356 RepID=A0ABR2K077_9EUKA
MLSTAYEEFTTETRSLVSIASITRSFMSFTSTTRPTILIISATRLLNTPTIDDGSLETVTTTSRSL